MKALATENASAVHQAVCTSGTSVGNACTIHNNCPPNTGANPGRCGTWWWADTGDWQLAGSMHVSINWVQSEAAPGETLAHEFVHLAFDARSLRRAADMVEIIDRSCEVILGCHAVGQEPPSLPEEAVETLRKMGDLVA